MSSCQCSFANCPDAFCYICREYTLKHQRKGITNFDKQSYFAYFDVKLGDQDKTLAPHKVCKTCVENLRLWKNGKLKELRFGVPMVWKEPQNHHDDYSFCMVNIKGFDCYKKKEVGISRFKVSKMTSSALREHSCACFHFTSSAS